jgi:hypothetical protein
MGDLSFKDARGAWHHVIQVARCALAALAFAVVVAASASGSTTARSPVPSAAPAGSLGVQLLDVPVAEAADPRARLYIVDHVNPGTVIHRRIEVSNTTASTMPVVLYPAAATIGNGLFVGAAGHTPNDLSTWTSVNPGASEVPVGGHVTAIVTIAVPRDASPGEQYGVVWAETRSTPPAGGGITEVSRVGVRIYLSVGRGGPPPSKFTIESLTARRTPNGQPMIVATVHNSGGLALDMYGTLQLSAGPGGLRAGPFRANLGVTLGIGDTEPVTIVLDKRLPAGPWDALVTLHSGLITNRAQATITFPTDGSAPPPYLAIIGLAIALLGITVLLVVIRQRRNLTLVAQNSNSLHQHDSGPT